MIWCLFGRGPGSWIRVDRSDVWSLITNSVGNSCIIVLLFFWFIVYLFECLICFLFSVICASCFWCNEFFLSLYCLGTLSLSNTSQFGATCSAMLTDVLSWVRFVLLRDNVPKQYKPKNNSHAITKNINNINISIGSDLVRQVAHSCFLYSWLRFKIERMGRSLKLWKEKSSRLSKRTAARWRSSLQSCWSNFDCGWQMLISLWRNGQPITSCTWNRCCLWFPLSKQRSHRLRSHFLCGRFHMTCTKGRVGGQWQLRQSSGRCSASSKILVCDLWLYMCSFDLLFRLGLMDCILIYWLYDYCILCILIFLNIYNINILQDIRYKYV